jgi:CubicO group peptidase (beta-lactamase class C family)
MTPDTLFALASLTKLLTTVAVLQQVERGNLALDQDISSLVPDLAAKVVIRPAAGKVPMGFEPRTQTITLRRLLNHSSGAGYDFLDLRLKAPASARKFSPPGDGPKANPRGTVSLQEHLYYNLSFQPGTSWTYGSGVSWAGRCLEVVTGQTLEAYFVENILKPLGIPEGSITFFPNNAQSPLPRASLTERHQAPKPKTKASSTSKIDPEADATRTVIKAEPATSMPWNPFTTLTDCLGGEGAFGAPGQFIKVMESLLRDDGRLLKPETTKLMFEGSLEPEPKKALRKAMETPGWVVGDIPPTDEYDWGLGGLLVDGDSHPWRRKGCLMWSGMINTFWVSGLQEERKNFVTDRRGAVYRPSRGAVRPLRSTGAAAWRSGAEAADKGL